MIKTIFVLVAILALWMFVTGNLTKSNIQDYQQKAIEINERVKEAYISATNEAEDNTIHTKTMKINEENGDSIHEDAGKISKNVLENNLDGENSEDNKKQYIVQEAEEKPNNVFIGNDMEDQFTKDELKAILSLLDEARAQLRRPASIAYKKAIQSEESSTESDVIKKKLYDGQKAWE